MKRTKSKTKSKKRIVKKRKTKTYSKRKSNGAAQLDGRMIDAASARMAKNIVNINKLIESK